MLNTIHDWQELISGVLALLAGTFIFVQGRLEARALEEARRQDIAKERAKTRLILERLDHACAELSDSIDEFLDMQDDVLTAIDRGDDAIEIPGRVVVPKLFEVIFAQLTTQDISIRVYIELSLLLEKATALDEDYRRFLVTYGQTVTQYRPTQPRLPLAATNNRRASDDPAAQTLIISTKALQEVIIELRSRISEDLAGAFADGGDIRASDERVD